VRLWLGLLPYFIVRALSVKYYEKSEHGGMIYHKAVGGDWICIKSLKGQQHDN